MCIRDSRSPGAKAGRWSATSHDSARPVSARPGRPGQRDAGTRPLLRDGRVIVEVLNVIGDPCVQVATPVAQAAAEFHRSRTEAGPPSPPRVQRRLRDGQICRSLVDREDATFHVDVDGRTHHVLLRPDEDRFALSTGGAHHQPTYVWTKAP